MPDSGSGRNSCGSASHAPRPINPAAVRSSAAAATASPRASAATVAASERTTKVLATKNCPGRSACSSKAWPNTRTMMRVPHAAASRRNSVGQSCASHAASSAGSAQTTSVPAEVLTPNTFLVRVESQLDYRPVISWAAGDKQLLGITSAFDDLPMNEAYYVRPRITQTIACIGCDK